MPGSSSYAAPLCFITTHSFFAYHGKDKKLSQSSCYLKNNGWELTLCPKYFRVVEFHALKNVAKLFMENRIHIFIYFPLNNLMPNFESNNMMTNFCTENI